MADLPAQRFDVDAETAVLASCLAAPNAPSAFAAAAAIIRSADEFYVPAHALVWSAMMRLAERGENTGTVSVVLELTAMDRLHSAGGSEFVAALTDYIPTITAVERYAHVVSDLACIRRVQAAAERSVAYARNPLHSAADVSEFTSRSILEAQEQRATNAIAELSDAINDVWSGIEESANSNRSLPGMPIGLRDLDRRIGGMRSGQFVVIGARPAMGKTALALKAAQSAATHGRVLFFSLEMPRIELAQRMMAAQARIDQTIFRDMRIDAETNARLVEASQQIYQLPLTILDGDVATLTDIRLAAMRARAREPLALIIVDYLQLMEGAGQNKHESRQEQVAKISRGLKRLAKDLACPILALSQLNRDPERNAKNKRPTLSALRESGAVEQDADVVLLLYRDEQYNPKTKDPGVAEIIIAKQRNGPIGTIRTRFVRQWAGFEDLDGSTVSDDVPLDDETPPPSAHWTDADA